MNEEDKRKILFKAIVKSFGKISTPKASNDGNEEKFLFDINKPRKMSVKSIEDGDDSEQPDTQRNSTRAKRNSKTKN